jgi:hypothetical protein
MKKIVTFGDSFIQPGYSTGNAGQRLLGIGDILEQKLGVPGVHYGAGGSSLQFSIKKFIDYATHAELYDPEDLILFVLTSDDRVYLPDSPDQSLSVVPGISEELSETHWFLKLLTRPGNKEWVDKNLKHAQFVKDKIYHRSINTETLRTLALLRSWASVHSNTVFVISAFDVNELHFTLPMLRELSGNTPNFLTHLSLGTHTSLLDCSSAEFVTTDDFMKTLCNTDPRLNHFTATNRDRLAQMIFEVFITNSMSGFKLDRLERGVHPSFIYGTPELGAMW